jgi:hypothetical protein
MSPMTTDTIDTADTRTPAVQPASASTGVPQPRVWAEPWARLASVKADAIERQMLIAIASGGPLSPRRQAAADAIRCLLASAREAIRRRGRMPWRGPVDRWRGTSVEHAFQSLHAAKVFLVEILANEDVDALAPSVLARLTGCLAPDDVRRLRVERIVAGAVAPPSGAQPDDRQNGNQRQRRADLRQAMEIGYDTADGMHARVRGFRNVLLVAGVLILLFMVALVVVVSYFPQAMPLCFHPTRADAGVITVCPSGEGVGRLPGAGDVAIVAGLGLIGGALAAAFGVRRIPGSTTPYDLPIALALLKVPSGALTAVTGILLLGGGFVPGLSELDSQRQILAYALVLGYAQQLATRFLDDRASVLLSSVPTKEAEARPPSPSAQALRQLPMQPPSGSPTLPDA